MTDFVEFMRLQRARAKDLLTRVYEYRKSGDWRELYGDRVLLCFRCTDWSCDSCKRMDSVGISERKHFITFKSMLPTNTSEAEAFMEMESPKCQPRSP
jgi:hypothetical protein